MRWTNIVPCLVAFVVAALLAMPAAAAMFPPAGQDEYATSRMDFVVELYGIGTHPGVLFGPFTVDRGDPYPDTTGGGQHAIDTEIISMTMTGFVGPWPAELTLQAGTPSLGKITDTNPDPAQDFPADSFFDIYFEIDVAGALLHNEVAHRMEATINEIPPDLSETPYLQVGPPTVLLDPMGEPVGELRNGIHSPEPATMGLMALGIGGLLLRRKRR